METLDATLSLDIAECVSSSKSSEMFLFEVDLESLLMKFLDLLESRDPFERDNSDLIGSGVSDPVLVFGCCTVISPPAGSNPCNFNSDPDLDNVDVRL